MTEEVRQKIRQAIWAVWDENKNRWMFEYSNPPAEFSYQLFVKYRRFIQEKAAIQETDVESLKIRVDALFENIPKESWMALFWRLEECLEECLKHFEVKELEDLFRANRSEVHVLGARIGLIGGGWSSKTASLQRTYRFTRTKRLEVYLREYYKRCALRYKELSKTASEPRTWSDSFRLDDEYLKEKPH